MRTTLVALLALLLAGSVSVLATGTEDLGLPSWLSETVMIGLAFLVGATLAVLSPAAENTVPSSRHRAINSSYARGADGHDASAEA